MLLTREEYKQSLSLLDRPFLRSPLLKELSNWGQETLNISILNYFCDQIQETGENRLRLLLWDRTEWARTMSLTERFCGHDLQIQEQAAAQFAALAQKYGLHWEYWQEEGFLTVFDTLRDEIEKDVLEQARGELEALVRDDIWRVLVNCGSIYIFYDTDDQLRQHEADGLSQTLRQSCGRIVAPYDTRKLFPDGPPCHFASYQTLREQYQGNPYLYFL